MAAGADNSMNKNGFARAKARIKAFALILARILVKVLGLRAVQVLIGLLVLTGVVIQIVEMEDRAAGMNKAYFSPYNMASDIDKPFFEGCVDTEEYKRDPEYERQNATFVMLTRNEEIKGVVHTIRSVERHFNQWFEYPYVLLNDKPFTQEFQDQVRSLTNAQVTFGTVDESQWNFENEDTDEFREYVESQGDRGIMYGNMVSYHKMCRFYSGMFYKHPAVQRHEWYWRIEPDVEFFCDLTYDPFLEMKRSGKKYGFTMFIKELYWAVPNLFRATKAFIREREAQAQAQAQGQGNSKVGSLWKVFVQDYNVLPEDEYLNKFANYPAEAAEEIRHEDTIASLKQRWQRDGTIDDQLVEELLFRAQRKVPVIEDKFEQEQFNLCHFWSNFEIARVDVFDNDIYDAYFQYLDRWGGFWKERWGDAPVHSLGLGLTLDLQDVHYFRDIGYQHSSLVHCPFNKKGHQLPYKGTPDTRDTVFTNIFYRKSESSHTSDTGSGCRCRCPTGRDVEDNAYYCLVQWFDNVFPLPNDT